MTANNIFDEKHSESDPFALFDGWFEMAEKSEPQDPNAMALATSDAGGLPNVRMVLLKAVDESGFVFYTNLESAKGTELTENPKAALCIHWKSLDRQIRARGEIEAVTDAEADAYYSSRHRSSRIGAWASKQSRPLESRFALEKEVARFTAKYAVGEIPRPSFWSGFRLKPTYVEFWRSGTFRLHDRLIFKRDTPDGPWVTSRYYP